MLKFQTGGFTTKEIGTEKRTELGGPDKLDMVEAPKNIPLENAETKNQQQSQKIKDLEERLMRMQAEFENYKKRVMRENEMLHEKAAADASYKLLSVVDELEIALSHVDKSSMNDFKRGIELIYAKLLDSMKREGIEEMKTKDQKFDPYKHDAIRQAEGEEGKIVEVVQKGYLMNGKILRHAKVVVGKGKEE